MSLLDRGDPLQAALDELVVDRLLDQRPGRARADLALVEGVEHEPLDGLVEEFVVDGHDVGEEDVRRLPPSSVVDGMMFCAAYCMISRPVAVSPVKAIFAIRLFVASALPISAPGPLTTLITPGGTMSSTSSISLRIDQGVGLAGLITAQLPGRERRRDLPRRHQQREVERDDLPDNAERLMEVVRDRVLVDLRDRPSSPRITEAK